MKALMFVINCLVKLVYHVSDISAGLYGLSSNSEL